MKMVVICPTYDHNDNYKYRNDGDYHYYNDINYYCYYDDDL